MQPAIKNIDDLLLSLGFNITAAKTYRALLELESVSIRKVAAATGINRGTTYEAIKHLVAAGLVSVRKTGQREYYTAETPEKINDIIRDRRKELIQTAESAKTIIPNIVAQKVRPQGRPLVRYYEDDEGIVTILKDVLQTCRTLQKPEYYAYSSRSIRKYLYRRFPEFTDKRVRENIHVRVIALGEGGEITTASERKWLEVTNNEEVSSYTIIYGNKVAIISLSNDFTPYGVIIEDPGAAGMQKVLFEKLWDKL